MKYFNFTLLVIIFIGYPLIYFNRWNVMNSEQILLPPNWQFIGGTDNLGRDYFFRCILGAYLSVIVAFSATVLTHFIGFIFASLSVLRFLKLKYWLPRIIDMLDTIPSYLVVSILAIFFQQYFKATQLVMKSLLTLVLSISLVSWMSVSRLLRLEMTQLLNREFIMSSQVLGAGIIDLLKDHFTRHTSQVVIISMIQTLPQFILMESFLSFLGIGLIPPYLSLGALISEGWKYAYLMPQLFFIPALFLTLISLQFKFITKLFKKVFNFI